MTISLLQRILDELPDMGSAERKVADVVRTAPSEVIHMSMARLSEACGTSDPTIMRFCRRLGFEGYQDFKLYLAQSLVPSAPFDYEQITSDDSVDNVVRKTCRNSLNAIQRLLEDLDPAQIARAAETMHTATWIGIYATGISEVTALDAEHKFQRLGLRCQALLGPKTQRIHAENARPGEVSLIFSQSGHTRQTVEIAKTVSARGANVVAVAAADSPLAIVSNVTVGVQPYDHTEVMTPLASRLNHHLVINMLVTAIAMKNGSEFPDQLPALDSWQTEKV